MQRVIKSFPSVAWLVGFALTVLTARADELPYDYEIEYLQGDGTAYIDLGFKLTGAYSLDVVFDPEITGKNQITGIIGARNSSSANWIGLTMEKTDAFSIDFYSSDRDTYKASYDQRGELSPDWVYRLKVSSTERALYHDGQCLAANMTTCATNFTTGKNCCIYTFGGGNGVWYRYTGKIYSVKIKNEATGELEYDLVPVRKGEVGSLYNKVTGQLHGNSNTAGAFILGPDKPKPGTLVVTGEPDEYGVPDPVYGWHEGMQPGEVRTLKAPPVWTNDEQTVFATCTGYKVYTNDFLCAQGSFSGDGEHSFEYVHPTESVVATVAWQFDATYRVSASATDGGTATVSGDGWFKSGERVTVTVEPANGFGFGVWEGDTVADHLFDNPLVFTMGTKPVALTAKCRKFVYVSKTGDDGNGGTSWDDALATIPAALEKDEAPYVLVDDGLYDISTAIVVEKPATISGRGSRGAVIRLAVQPSDGTDKANGVFYVNHPQARLTGLAAIGSANLNDLTKNQRGRGICLLDGQIDDCSITNNITVNLKMDGGGIKMSGGVVRDCLIANNVAKTSSSTAKHGGGVWMNKGLLENCVIRGNRAQSGKPSSGGGVWAEGGIVRNCLIVGNQSADGGAASGANVKNALMENCTIVGNTQGTSTTCTGMRAQSGATVRNTIVYNNTNASGVGNVAWEDGSTFENVLTTDDCTAEGVINAAPAFVDADNGDWHIGFGAAVDAGVNQDWMVGATDLDGHARILNRTVDLGCYEYVPSDELACGFDVTTDGTLDTSVVTLTATVNGADPAEVTFDWTLTDSLGRTITTNLVGQAVVAMPIPTGFYSVALAVSAGGKSAKAERPSAFTVFAKDIYVSPTGSNVLPYRDFDTGATNVNEALLLATDGSAVHLSDGVHRVAEHVMLGAAIRLVHEGDREACVLTGGKEGDCLVLIDHADAFLSGVDVWGSYPQRFVPQFSATTGKAGVPFYLGSGIRVNSHGGTVSNCVVECCAGTVNGAGVRLSAGLLVDSVIRNNQACSSGGGGANGGGVYLEKGTVDRCVVSNNCAQCGTGGTHGGGVYVKSGALRNSLVAHNYARQSGGGVWVESAGAAQNCTIVLNEAYEGRGGLAGTAADCLVYGNYEAGVQVDLSDPGFVNAVAEDFHLNAASTAIDASVESGIGELDLDGNNRYSGGVADLGCYEFDQSVFSLGVTYERLSEFYPGEVAFAASAGRHALDPDRSWWTFDGSEPTAEHFDLAGLAGTNTLAPGVYTVRFKTVYEGVAHEVTNENWFVLNGQTVYVNAQNEHPRIPYATWDSAASDINDAFAYLVSGATMVVTDGTYHVTTRQLINRKATIRSLNGPENTVFKGAYPTAFELSHAEALLTGFTFEGFANSGSNVGRSIELSKAGATVSNCVFKNCRATGSGAAVYLTAGNVVDCLFTNCYASSSGNTLYGHAIRGEGAGTLVDRCVIRDCGWTGWNTSRESYSAVCLNGGATIRNSLVVHNRSQGFGGIYLASGGVAENCTVVDNVALKTGLAAGVHAAEDAIAVNLLAYGNTNAADQVAAEIGGEDSAFDTCCTNNPCFRRGGKYLLKTGSPCLNTGKPLGWMEGAVDLYGNPRILYGKPDIGAVESPYSPGLILYLR